MKTLVVIVMLIFLFVCSSLNAAVVAYWDCDQNETDPILIDRVGDANGVLEAKDVGPPPYRMKFVPSGAGLGGIDYGYALWTDNLNDRANLGEVDTYDFGKNDFTITGWFKTNNSARHGCILRHGWWGVSGFDVVVLKNNGRLIFEVFGSDPNSNKGVISDQVLNDDQWHWFAGVISSETIYLYIDGELQPNSGVTYDPNTTATVDGWDTYINMDMAGTVDDITIYDTSLVAMLDANDTLVAGELYFVWHGIPSTGPTDCDEIWQAGYGNKADFNKDCHVNFKDFADFSVEWLKCNDPQDSNCIP